MIPLYPTFAGEIARRGIKKADIAEAINVTYKTFRNKCDGISPFTFDEVRMIQSTFFPDVTMEELFKRNA